MTIVQNDPAAVILAVGDGCLGLDLLAFTHTDDFRLLGEFEGVGESLHAASRVSSFGEQEEYRFLFGGLSVNVLNLDLDGIDLDVGSLAEHSFDEFLAAQIVAVRSEASDEYAEIECAHFRVSLALEDCADVSGEVWVLEVFRHFTLVLAFDVFGRLAHLLGQAVETLILVLAELVLTQLDNVLPVVISDFRFLKLVFIY